jgi:hypothetical protein
MALKEPFKNPFRPALPLLLGCAPPVALVAFLCLFHNGKDPVDALKFAAATFLASLMATVVAMVFGASIAAAVHREWLKLVALRLIVPVMGAIWYWVGFKREWFGTFSMSLPGVDGAYNAVVTLSDLAAGFAVIPLAAGLYHRKWLWDRYCNADPRTLGALRIVMGLLLVGDSLRHWKEARWFYANTGVLTNHYLLFKPFSGHNLSLWNAFSSLGEVHVVFALATLCYFFLLVGYRTRLFSILSFVAVTSMDNRLVLVENGGYVVVNLLVGWAMFMPLGRRFSVDALIRSYREHKEKTWDDLNRRFRPADKTELQWSGIYMLATVNIAIIYFFNVVNKSGHLWKSGHTVHYVLHLDRMVTGVAVVFRELLPAWTMQGITWIVLAVESLICVSILSPYGRRYTRPLAMVSMHLLHTAFGVMFRLGPFSWFMIAWSYLLPRPDTWADLGTWFRKRASPRAVVLDRSSPLAFAIGRLLARLDGMDLLVFKPSPEGEGGRPPLVAVEMEGGLRLTGSDALREIMQAIPCGRLARGALWVASLGTLGWMWRAVEARREGIARFFGLGLSAKGAPELPPTSPLRERMGRVRVTARETFIAYLATCAFLQMMSENKCFPPQLKPKLPPYMAATIGYTRTFQGWGMFAANPITDDGSVSIDAITVDGRHVDPFTGKAPDLDLTDARGLGLEQIWQDYFNRIRLERNKTYREGLKEYLLRWHLETGRPEDELVAFDVYWLRDQCPPPGSLKPYAHERIALLTWRKPGYKPPPGQPPLPSSPRIGNAESKPDAAPKGDPRDAPPPEEKRGSGDVGL